MNPILIAECCQNHGGDRETLKTMIHKAVENGADYVKIQGLYSEEVTRRERFEQGKTAPDGTPQVIHRPYQPEVERLKKLDLSLEDEAWFVNECVRAGTAPLITVFTREGIRRVRDLGFEAAKIASYDCRSYPLLREAKECWNTLFVSTGATFDNEIARAAAVLAGCDYTFLHCVTLYPTPMDQLHLRRLNHLRRFTPKVGFSDHSKPGESALWASKIALAVGASCVERHFTVQDASKTKDGPVSVDPSMLSELRAFADLPRAERMQRVRHEYPGWEVALGKAARPLSDEELLNRDYYSGRVASRVEGQVVYNWEDIELG